MLKRRLIPVLNIMNGLIVRSENFLIHQNIGNIINQASRYNDWEVDELIYLDISRDSNYSLRREDHKVSGYSDIGEVIRRISKVCFMPLTFGGGIRTLEDASFRIRNGADKVVVNTGAHDRPSLVTEIANKFGSQAAIVSIDYRMVEGTPTVFTEFGLTKSKLDIVEWAKRCEAVGAGEIFLRRIDYDGQAAGYDIDNINSVVKSINIPVIACGGACDSFDFITLANETDVSGIAAGNMFHFTERSYPRAKMDLKRENINVR